MDAQSLLIYQTSVKGPKLETGLRWHHANVLLNLESVRVQVAFQGYEQQTDFEGQTNNSQTSLLSNMTNRRCRHCLSDLLQSLKCHSQCMCVRVCACYFARLYMHRS